MNNIAIIEEFWEYDYVTYYTVRLEINDKKERLTETDKFYEKFDDENHSHFKEFDTIVRVIDAIGSYEAGAEDCLFRPEDAAHALPPKRKEADRILEIEIIKHSELRLYCIRLTNEVVILLNGDIKTEDGALYCPNVKGHFRFAQSIAKAIGELMLDDAIEIKGKKIINNTDEENIVLYY